MFDFIKRRFIIAEVDGIKFYSSKALHRYLAGKERDRLRKGKRMYTFEIPWYQRNDAAVARNALEERGCFDYKVSNDGGNIIIQYWADHILLKWKA